MSMVPKTLLYNRLPEGYNYADNSFLKSICTVIPDVPQTLLREHYRCHPKIIGFCNQKFYQNQLMYILLYSLLNQSIKSSMPSERRLCFTHSLYRMKVGKHGSPVTK